MTLVKRDYQKTFQERLARQQVTFEQTQKADIVGGVYNNWYAKWQGEGKDFGKEVDQNPYRLVVARDAGRTKANSFQPFCIHFAHGRCSKGSSCRFLHRIPIDTDQPQTTIDCFGRDKFRNHRDDMGGIGSFEKPVQTLYVGNIGINDHMKVFFVSCRKLYCCILGNGARLFMLRCCNPKGLPLYSIRI
jgi:hypothetical protein